MHRVSGLVSVRAWWLPRVKATGVLGTRWGSILLTWHMNHLWRETQGSHSHPTECSQSKPSTCHLQPSPFLPLVIPAQGPQIVSSTQRFPTMFHQTKKQGVIWSTWALSMLLGRKRSIYFCIPNQVVGFCTFSLLQCNSSPTSDSQGSVHSTQGQTTSSGKKKKKDSSKFKLMQRKTLEK